MSKLIITDVAIRQDSQNRYCLNDLHKASGNKQKDKPANWLRLEQTKALIEVVERCSDVRNAVNIMQGGTHQGTFVVKQMVYAYAMWISAEFQLQVINAYDALVTGEVPEHIVKAYDELVANKTSEDLKVITAPLSVAEFEARYAYHKNALENLKNVQIILTAKDFLSLKADKKV